MLSWLVAINRDGALPPQTLTIKSWKMKKELREFTDLLISNDTTNLISY